MRVSKRAARIVRLAVPTIRREPWPTAVSLMATLSAKDRAIGREILRRDLARRARADVRTYWAMRANDGGA